MDWKAIVSAVSPWIASAIGGPLGGMAVSAIGDALGLSDKTENAIKQALSGATPEQMLALKNADQQFALRMQELGFQNLKDMEELAFKDRDSARNREIQTNDSTNKVLAYGIVIVWAILNMILFMNTVPHGSEQLVARLLGTLDAALMVVLYYYFGSSYGSNKKNELLANK